MGVASTRQDTDCQRAPVIVRPGADWEVTPARPSSKIRARGGLDRLEYLNAYDRLADGIVASPGFDGKPVRKVKSDVVRDELKSRGFLLLDDKGHVTSYSRKQLHGAKLELLKSRRLVENDGLIWRA
jgi:hypothetical protein